MNRANVSSSNIVSIGYDEKSKILEVEFKEGRVYQYNGVPKEAFEKLMASSSHGTFLSKFIKDKYPHHRLS